MSNDSEQLGFSTRAIHLGYDAAQHHGALVPPIHLSATFTFESAEHGGQLFAGERAGYFYTRIANPTLALLEQRMASLEGGEAAVSFGSGMGAITSTLWTLLRPGDEIIVDRTLYGCTFAFLHHGIAEFGVKVRHVDLRDPKHLEKEIGPHTKVVFFETPANPSMSLVDIAAIAEIAHRHKALVIVDNTYCSPYLQQPLSLGADVIVHSATKYISGHGDVTAGIAVSNAETIERIRLQGLKDLTGAVLSPQDAFLLLRGLKTLSLRLERHCDNAEVIADLLCRHPAVKEVHYPGLPDFPQHTLACRQMRRFGGMLAFELEGGEAAGKRFINALRLIARAVSLGDSESLVQHPASMTHSTYTPEERARYGISDGLVRISAGLEDTADLLADITQALDHVSDASLGNSALTPPLPTDTRT